MRITVPNPHAPLTPARRLAVIPNLLHQSGPLQRTALRPPRAIPAPAIRAVHDDAVRGRGAVLAAVAVRIVDGEAEDAEAEEQRAQGHGGGGGDADADLDDDQVPIGAAA